MSPFKVDHPYPPSYSLAVQMVSRLGEELKKMADWLRSGATMLTESCPECNSPLFRRNEEIWCLKCNKRVIKAKEAEPSIVLEETILLEELRRTTLLKLKDLQVRLSSEEDPERIQQISELTLLLLKLLGRIDSLKSH